MGFVLEPYEKALLIPAVRDATVIVRNRSLAEEWASKYQLQISSEVWNSIDGVEDEDPFGDPSMDHYRNSGSERLDALFDQLRLEIERARRISRKKKVLKEQCVRAIVCLLNYTNEPECYSGYLNLIGLTAMPHPFDYMHPCQDREAYLKAFKIGYSEFRNRFKDDKDDEHDLLCVRIIAEIIEEIDRIQNNRPRVPVQPRGFIIGL